MIYLLLLSGIFMGWSLGTNDGANAFGTAVGTGVISYRRAVLLIAVFVVIGAWTGGAGNLTELSELAVSNKVSPSAADVADAVRVGNEEALRLNSAVKAALILGCTGVTVFVMSLLKFPVSANQSTVGAMIGWGLCYADYGDPGVLAVNLPQIGKFASAWILSPLLAAAVTFGLASLANKYAPSGVLSGKSGERALKAGYTFAGILASYSIGVNSSANVTALYYDMAYAVTGRAANLLVDAKAAAVIGGVAIALGVLTYSRPVMTTVGEDIAKISPTEGFIAVIGMALTVLIMGRALSIPVSTSQAVVGAVMGAGLTRGKKNVNFSVLKRIGAAWIGSPLASGTMTYIVAMAVRGYFA